MRGAALVEGVVVVPLFVLLWFVALYAHRLHAAHLANNAAARAESWGYAMNNCGRRGDSSQTPTPGGVVAQRITENGSGAPIRSLMGGGSGGKSNRFLDVAAALLAANPLFLNSEGSQSERQSSVKTQLGSGDGHEQQVTSRVRVYCNEAPENGNLVGVVRSIWQTVGGAFH